MLRAADTVLRTDTGRARQGNEDSSYARAPVFVVADGMGGAQAGEVASRLAIEAFEEGLPRAGTPEERLSVVVQRANRAIYDRANAEARYDGMGTTVTAAYLDDDHVVIAHVGDSRAYRLRGGELTRLTEDHSLVAELLRGGKLTEEEAAEHPQRSIITRVLGVEPIVEVDTFTYAVRPGDVILLCSDGLTSMISERQVAEIILAAPNLERAAQRLIDEANAAGGRDNITVLLFRVEEVGESVADQPTVVGEPVSAATGFPASGLPQPPPRDVPAGNPSDPRSAGPQVRVPLARRQGWLRVSDRRHERPFDRTGKAVSALVAVLVVLFLFGGAGYLATRELYFLGTDRQGTVVVYRGLPYRLPLGIALYETFYVSGVPAQALPADRRGALLSHQLKSQNAAIRLINDLELGKIAG
jgi:protein phosphatase